MCNRLLLRVSGLVMMALLALAFATATVARAAPTATEVRLEAFQLAGGVADDLCNTKDSDHPHLYSCSLCHLISSGDLPEAMLSLTGIEQLVVATVILPQLRRAAARPRDPATPPRGPPAIQA